MQTMWSWLLQPGVSLHLDTDQLGIWWRKSIVSYFDVELETEVDEPISWWLEELDLHCGHDCAQDGGFVRYEESL